MFNNSISENKNTEINSFFREKSRSSSLGRTNQPATNDTNTFNLYIISEEREEKKPSSGKKNSY